MSDLFLGIFFFRGGGEGEIRDTCIRGYGMVAKRRRTQFIPLYEKIV